MQKISAKILHYLLQYAVKDLVCEYREIIEEM